MAITDRNEIERKIMVVLFVIDTSGGMDKKMNELNRFMENFIVELKRIETEYYDADIKIAVLAYSDSAKWITGEAPVDVSKFQWRDLKAAGNTNPGEAFKALEEKLLNKTFMPAIYKSFAPAIFLISGSAPSLEWEKPLERLKKRSKWYKAAIKAAIAIGNADRSMLVKFTGTHETILDDLNPVIFEKYIKFVAAYNPDSDYGEVTKKFPNGDVYEGDWYYPDNVPQGYGKMTYANGDVYEGGFTNGLPNGEGEKIYADGRVYEGEFKEGKPHGKGKGTLKDGSIKEGMWQEGKYCGSNEQRTVDSEKQLV